MPGYSPTPLVTLQVFPTPRLIADATIKPRYSLVTSYLRNACIQHPYVTVAAPTGMMTSYEGGYTLRALIYKAGAGEVALAKSCLDEWVKLQKADGSWSERYHPYQNVAGLHDEYEDIQVDSGVALLAWAMVDYDKSVGPGSVVYKTDVQKALQWLRDAQAAFSTRHGINLLCNMKFHGAWDYVALAADCGESLLAAKRALDQYGAGLLTSGGYSVATFCEDLYYAMANYLWTGDAGRYYMTAYPAGGIPKVPFPFKEKISYTQALCAWATYEYAVSPYRTGLDYSAQSEKALDFITTITAGKWGGYFYSPYYALPGETRNEFAAYTGLMVMAMNTVNSAKYADHISRGRIFLRWLALEDGRVYDFVEEDGALNVAAEGYGFLAHNSSLALLAGA